jgi:hypothetical protein
MKKILGLVMIALILPFLVGCPGNSGTDKKAADDLWAWVSQQDKDGWVITGFANNKPYTNIIVDHKWRPTKFELAIKGDEVNPYHQRNMIEDIARKWQSFYPANMKPRFNMRVEIYNLKISSDSELGYTEIDKDGTVKTHHSKTQDVL